MNLDNSKDKVFYYMFLFHTCKLNMVLLIICFSNDDGLVILVMANSDVL